MKAVITGFTGTVGQALAAELGAQTAIPWDRSAAPPNDYARMEQFLRATAPDVVFHLAIASQPTGLPNESWLINYEWPSELAWLTRQLGIGFVFTSSVMVFSDDAKGPFTPASQPDATAGYGYEKRMAEARVMAQNPEARVVRLGWQIGEQTGTNTMLTFFEQQMVEQGQIAASTRWYPACSFLPDTAAALVRAATKPGGLYLVDSNTRWTFFEIAQAMNHQHGDRWQVVPNADFVFDQRMIDQRLEVPTLKQRLPMLAD